ncbi:MAG: thrombospondin type 3 repeat-containing protein [Acidobacteria bacterium]|nr:thrombospondin type 3 repeat-containing protein [Acidobacteriota bacterium]
MPSSSRLHRWILLVVALVPGGFGCTISDPQVGEIGAVSLLTVDPAIVPQAVILAPPGTITSNRVQAMLWDITLAKLIIGDQEYDLLFPVDNVADCRAIDSPNRITLNFGTCVENLVLESVDEDAGTQARLELAFTVRLKRVIPVVLPYIGDEDMDGILNGNDNCILVANPGQEDSGNLGIGNACRVVDFFSGVRLDSDADGIADTVDNCVHRANPDQANPPSPDDFDTVISDGIGLACEDEEQIIECMGNVDTMFDFILPSTQGFVVVDFNDDVVFPNWAWDTGTCSGFDDELIEVCIRTTVFEVSQGCS